MAELQIATSSGRHPGSAMGWPADDGWRAAATPKADGLSEAADGEAAEKRQRIINLLKMAATASDPTLLTQQVEALEAAWLAVRRGPAFEPSYEAARANFWFQVSAVEMTRKWSRERACAAGA